MHNIQKGKHNETNSAPYCRDYLGTLCSLLGHGRIGSKKYLYVRMLFYTIVTYTQHHFITITTHSFF